MPDFRGGPMGPAYHCFAITPDDADAITPVPKAIRADADGAVTMRFQDSAADVTLNLAAGEVIYGVITHVRDTGTDAITIHGFA